LKEETSLKATPGSRPKWFNQRRQELARKLSLNLLRKQDINLKESHSGAEGVLPDQDL